MTQVSKNKLNKQVYEKIFSLFPQFLGRLSKQGYANIAINTLFSSTERVMIAKRIAVAFMLVKGYGYHEISSKLKVSFGTIAKIADITKQADKKFVAELQIISQEDQFVEFLKAIGYKIAVMLPPKGGNWSVWRKNIDLERLKGKQVI